MTTTAKEKKYSELSELEKIPLRIETARKIAEEEFHKGIDLDYVLKRCVESEYYCGAEGIKRFLQTLNQSK